MIGDRELLEFRRGYYELLAGLLAREPAAILLRSAAEGVERRIDAGREMAPALGEGWEGIAAYLATRTLDEAAEAAADEFTRLFLGPRDPLVLPYESYYLTGRVFERPLAAVREFLEEVGLEKDPSGAEPEDFLALELSVMVRLIERQERARDPDAEAEWLNRQAAFLKKHLLVWGPKCAQDLVSASGGQLYRAVGRLLEGFLQLERELFAQWGPEPLRSLEEARAAFGRAGEWRGPLLDAAPGDRPGGAVSPPPSSPAPPDPR